MPTRMIFFRKVLLQMAAATLLSGTMSIAWGDGVDRRDPKPEKLEGVEVAGHYDNAVGTSDAASQGSVTAKLIENRPVLRPAEVLEFVPGLIVTQHSGDGKANQYFLRGFNLDHGTDFATFVAGMPVNMPTHVHGQGYSDLNFLIPELVDHLDYLKGPYYASEGDFSSAGAAHIHLANTLRKGIAQLTGGGEGYGRALLADSLAVSGGNVLYGIELGRNNGPWDVPEHLHKWNGVVRWSAGTADSGYSVTAMGYQSKWNSTDQIAQRAVDEGLIDRFGAIDPTDGGETARYSLSFDMRQRNDWGFFTANAYAVRSRLNLFSDFTYYLDNPVDGDQFEQAERRTMLGGAAAQSFFGKLAGMDSMTRVGVQVRGDRLSPVALYANVARERIGTTREDHVKETSAAIFVENTLQWAEKVRGLVGLRHDRYDFDVTSNIADNSGKVNASITSPKASLVFGPWAKTEFFANWGRGFHSNDARGTAIHVDPKTGEAANPVTPLVRSRGYEGGARTEIVPGLQSSIALWRLDLASELIFVGDAGTTVASRPSRRRGVEWNNHYVLNRNVLVDLDLAASRSNFTDDYPVGKHIPGAIDKVASFGVALMDFGPWFGSFQLRYFGPRPLIEDDSVRSRATTLAYVRVGYKPAPHWKLALDVFNLFDRKASDIDYYYASRLPGEPADGVNDIHFHPVERRSYRLTLTLNF